MNILKPCLALAALTLLASCVQINVEALSQDSLDGRNNDTAGSAATQAYLINLLKELGAAGLDSNAAGDDAFKQGFTNGTNILGVIPGTDLADEYVIIGAHYDHITHCEIKVPGDTVCNGATDNAAGVAAAIELGLYLSLPNNEPRRSVILAFWDREEDGLLGSLHYVANPLRPLADTVAYINFDILGANLLPSLRNISFAIGAETGGAGLSAAVQAAVATRTLDTRQFSALFGQNRSDYASFIGVGVPTVFFSDSTGPCYHTNGDDLSVVDFGKLQHQIAIAWHLTRQLADGTVTPVFDGAAPAATYDDAITLDNLLQLALSDLDRFTPAQQATAQAHAATMATLVAEGSANFDGADVTTMLLIALEVVALLTEGDCDGFLAP